MKWLICLLVSLHGINGNVYDYRKLSSVHLLKPEDFYSFINTTDVRPVFFSTSMTSDKHHRFFLEYNSSAAILKKFQMKVGLLDCVMYGKDIPLCETEAVHKDIYVFKQFEVLLKLSLETMFDVDSIVSNLLQLLYLNEIPIIQTQEERLEFEKSNLGKKSVIFCQIKAMGTFEHRVFLEVAHEFMDEYIFVVSTTTNGPAGLSDYEVQKKIVSAQLWFVDCHRPDNRGPGCLSVRYRSGFSTDNIKNFINLLPNPFVFDIPKDGEVAVYEKQQIHIGYLIYNTKCWVKVNKEARRLSQIYHATIGIVLVDFDNTDSSKVLKLDLKELKPPIFAIKLSNKSASVMIHQFREENIDLFIEKHLRIVAKERIKERERNENVSVVGESEFDDSVLTPDDEVAESIRTIKTRANTTLIRSLDDKSFYDTRQKSKAMLVLFYMKFDPVSMTFQRSYAFSSHQHPMKREFPLTMIECFDWTDVCQKENVTSYPIIRVYRPFSFNQYEGQFDGQTVLNYFRLHYIDNPVRINTSPLVVEFLRGLYPAEPQQVADILILGALKSKSDEAAIFEDLSDVLHGYHLAAVTFDKTAEEVCSQHSLKVPCLILSNKKDLIKPIHVFQGQFNKKSIMKFIKSLRTATFVELNALNFPSYYQQKMPIIILFVDPLKHKKVYEQVRRIAATDAFPKLLFTWMDVSSVGSLGTSILAMYTDAPSVPAIVYVDLVKAEVFLHNRKSTSDLAIKRWLRNVQNGQLMPDHTLPSRDWKPVKSGYDFSQGVPREILEDEEDIKLIVNEHGLGFDAEGQPLKEEDDNSDKSKNQGGQTKKPKAMMMDDNIMKDEL